jgi:hypothetical protein
MDESWNDFSMDLETIPLTSSGKLEPPPEPCDRKALLWCGRTSMLTILSILLLSMSAIAWNQYTVALNIDDEESPKVLAMGNDCTNKSWNIQYLAHDKNWWRYEILYYEKDIEPSSLYLDSVCNNTMDIPYISIQKFPGECCRWILYNTI